MNYRKSIEHCAKRAGLEANTINKIVSNSDFIAHEKTGTSPKIAFLQEWAKACQTTVLSIMLAAFGDFKASDSNVTSELDWDGLVASGKLSLDSLRQKKGVRWSYTAFVPVLASQLKKPVAEVLLAHKKEDAPKAVLVHSTDNPKLSNALNYAAYSKGLATQPNVDKSNGTVDQTVPYESGKTTVKKEAKDPANMTADELNTYIDSLKVLAAAKADIHPGERVRVTFADGSTVETLVIATVNKGRTAERFFVQYDKSSKDSFVLEIVGKKVLVLPVTRSQISKL